MQGEGRRKDQLYDAYPDYTFGAIGAWAWGYSRCVDALEILCKDKEKSLIDLSLIAFSGHSRGGKTAALAGAVDTRAAVVNPNETCAGASENLYWYFREGTHYHTPQDVKMLVNIMKRQRDPAIPMAEGFFQTPFPPFDPID